MNEQQIKLLTVQQFGAPPDTIERMTFGHCNVVYEVGVKGKSFIIRTNEDASVLEGTVHNLRTLAALGLPVPEVVSVDISRERCPFAYMILPKIPGRDLRYELPGMTKAQMTAVAKQIVHFQLQANKLPAGAGYGWVPVGQAAPFHSWLDVITEHTGKHLHHLQPEFSERDLAVILQGIERIKPYLLQVPPQCFLDDMTIKNVIVQAGELQGIIDFDWVCYGDSLYWIGLTQTAILCDIGPESEAMFYVEELCRLSGTDAKQRRLIDFYSVLHGLQFLGFLKNEKTPEAAGAANVRSFIRGRLPQIAGDPGLD
jgi:aminoglycoside phosphotransferase (APT) family kinase protein